MKSLSVSEESTNSFISSCLVLLLHLNEHETKQFQQEFKQWVKEANEFVRAIGATRTFTSLANKYILKKEFTEEDATKLGTLLRDKRALIEKDVTINRRQLRLINDIALNLRTASKAAWDRIHNDVSYLGNSKLNAEFTVDETTTLKDLQEAQAKKEASSIVKKVTGRTGYFLTPEESKELRENKPELYSKYAQAAKVLNKIVKVAIFNYVRSSGKPRVLIDDLKKHLDSKKIANNLPVGFTGGMMDDKGIAYTKEGLQLDRTPFGIVQMNPKYDPEANNTYVLKGVDHKVVYRTLEFTKSNKLTRHQLVQDFLKNESAHRDKWLADLKADGTKKQILAAMVELMYATSARIGGEKNETKGVKTYGTSTLLVEFIKILPDRIEINYLGKKGTAQPSTYYVKDAISKKVYQIIKKCAEGKGPKDRLFTYKNKPLSAQLLRLYFKALGIKISPHRLRTLAATKMAMKILARAPFKKGQAKQAQVEKWIKEEFKEIGKMLHHRTGEKVTSSTALKAYIDPEVIKAYFDKLGLRSPSFYKS